MKKKFLISLKGILFKTSRPLILMFAYFISKICSMQINNAGIGGVVIKDNDLLSLAIINGGVSI